MAAWQEAEHTCIGTDFAGPIARSHARCARSASSDLLDFSNSAGVFVDAVVVAMADFPVPRLLELPVDAKGA